MPMLVELSERVATRLNYDAQEHGTTIDNYLTMILDHAPKVTRRPEEFSLEESKVRFENYKMSRRSDLPVLSDEATSREVIYEGR